MASSERPFVLWKEEFRRVYADLRGAELSPARAGLSVALGLFIGSQPIFGLHTPLVIGLCLWLRLDGFLAWIASNISNPFFAPFLLTAEVWVGGSLLEGAPIRLDQRFESFWDAALGAPALLFVGSPLLGAALALVGGLVSFAFVAVRRRAGVKPKVHVYRLPKSAPPWVVAAERVASRYVSREGSTPRQRTQFNYVRIKLMSDPIARLVAEFAEAEGLGELCDLGTGRGQLPILLLELGLAKSARGVDWDRAKIEDAKAAARGERAPEGEPLPALDAEFEAADVRDVTPEPADTVLLIDVLHYLPLAAQDEVLDRAARAVRPGGRILVREADTERGLRSVFTLIEEKVFTTLRWNRGERVVFRPARQIAERLLAAGLSTEVRPAWGKTPFSNVLVIGRRAAQE
jgi:uncharacterized protein (DUF2062 family)/2-polyprenyl-3-methyl-5-hydroxy-6-metoxy-1,4-benzoquinol methylase